MVLFDLQETDIIKKINQNMATSCLHQLEEKEKSKTGTESDNWSLHPQQN